MRFATDTFCSWYVLPRYIFHNRLSRRYLLSWYVFCLCILSTEPDSSNLILNAFQTHPRCQYVKYSEPYVESTKDIFFGVLGSFKILRARSILLISLEPGGSKK